MKKYILILSLILLSATCGWAQTKKPKPQPKQEEEVPTQKEMEEMMREAQKAMDEMDPESKKAMDSMGFKMPSFNNTPQFTDAQIRQAVEDDNRLVPEKDATRIASISKTPLTNASIPGYLTTTHSKVVQQLSPGAKAKGDEIYQALKTQYHSARATGNSATMLWAAGKPELALYIMSKACQDDPANTDNLSNYAAMLSMGGGEQHALPVLTYLNKRFPKNSTILNNIGQAWFGLGDLAKATPYLDSAIKLYPFHSQANLTKSFIEESKGNKAGAIESAKRAIKNSYSPKKEDRLNKLGYKLKSSDLNWDPPMPADPLALEQFDWPAFPMNVNESEKLERDWNDFKEKCSNELRELSAQEQKLTQAVGQAMQKRMQAIMKASQTGTMINPMPPLAPKAAIKLKYLVDIRGDRMLDLQKKTEALGQAGLYSTELEDVREKKMKEYVKKYEDRFGEGKDNPFETACADENNITNAFLSKSNDALQKAYMNYLSALRRKLNDEVYYNQYMQWPEEFELTKVHAKMTWLTSIRDQKVNFQSKGSWCGAKEEEKKPKPFKLANFDDVHCEYHSTFTTPVGSMQMDCSRWTTTLDLKAVKLELKQDMDKDTFADQFTGCSVEVGVGTGVGVSNGPLKAEASIGAHLGLEFDRNGLSDVTVSAGAEVSAGTDIIKDGSMAGQGVKDLSVDAGVEGKISLISGRSSVGGTGIFGK